MKSTPFDLSFGAQAFLVSQFPPPFFLQGLSICPPPLWRVSPLKGQRSLNFRKENWDPSVLFCWASSSCSPSRRMGRSFLLICCFLPQQRSPYPGVPFLFRTFAAMLVEVTWFFPLLKNSIPFPGPKPDTELFFPFLLRFLN